MMPLSTRCTSPTPSIAAARLIHYFLRAIARLADTDSLVRAAVAVSLHALDDVNPERFEQRLRVLGLRVRERSPSRSDTAILANLHAVLFEEEGFAGNLERYYNALNSYLPAVLNTRRGLPIVLALIYKAVGEHAGLTIEGINAPCHFLVRVRCDNRWMIVDPFFGGQVLTRDEAFDRLDRVAGKRLPRKRRVPAASHAHAVAGPPDRQSAAALRHRRPPRRPGRHDRVHPRPQGRPAPGRVDTNCLAAAPTRRSTDVQRGAGGDGGIAAPSLRLRLRVKRLRFGLQQWLASAARAA